MQNRHSYRGTLQISGSKNHVADKPEARTPKILPVAVRRLPAVRQGQGGGGRRGGGGDGGGVDGRRDGAAGEASGRQGTKSQGAATASPAVAAAVVDASSSTVDSASHPRTTAGAAFAVDRSSACTLGSAARRRAARDMAAPSPRC